jgi:parvulin-like peptidyl-prolyl isomerase
MIRSLWRHALLPLLLFAAASSALATGNYPGNAVRVNGVDVSYQRFMGLYQEHQRDRGVAIAARGDQLPLLTEMRKEAMDMLIEQELIIQAAAAKGIEVSAAEIDAAWADISEPFDSKQQFLLRLDTEGYTEDSYRDHLKRMIPAKKYLDEIRLQAMQVSDEELEQYYRDNEYRLTLPEQVRVRHILLSWKPLGKPDDRAALLEQMQAILDKARAGEDFEQLAAEYSDDSSRMHGGDVGFFQRGQMVPLFETAAFALKQPGDISDIVETNFGLHIIRLEEHKPAYLVPLDEVREKLRAHISEEKVAKAETQEKARLRADADIEILIRLERPKQQN